MLRAILFVFVLLLGCGPADGPHVDYHDNGKVKEKGAYRNGKKTGSWTFYWRSETIKVEGTYVEDKPDGTWRFYDERGHLIGEGVYKNGDMWDGRFVRYLMGTKKIIVVKEGRQIN